MCLIPKIERALTHIQVKIFLTMSAKGVMLKRKQDSKGLKMKKLGVFLILVLLIGGGLFLWLLGQASPDNANSEVITIDIQDKFEK